MGDGGDRAGRQPLGPCARWCSGGIKDRGGHEGATGKGPPVTCGEISGRKLLAANCRHEFKKLTSVKALICEPIGVAAFVIAASAGHGQIINVACTSLRPTAKVFYSRSIWAPLHLALSTDDDVGAAIATTAVLAVKEFEKD